MFRDTGLCKHVTSDGWVLLCLTHVAQQDRPGPSQAAAKGISASFMAE